jgi:hypothetical protein
MVNNMMEFMADVPPLLLAAWTSWFVAGGVLAMWYRRAVELEYAPAPAMTARLAARPKAASRPPSGVRREEALPLEPAAEPAGGTSHLYEPPPALAPVVAREKKPTVIGDPFGDLATLLDQPQAAVAAPAYRAPGDSPILSSTGAPFRRANDEPKLG